MSAEKGETKKKKGLTWAEAAKQVLERSVEPLTHKDILKVIQDEGLRDLSRGNAPLACLNAMLHHHSRGPNDLFVKVEGRMSCYKLNPNRVESPGENSTHDSDSDLASMPEDTEFNHFSDKDSRHLTNGKVKIPLGTKEIEMPQLKPPLPNPPPRDSDLKPSLTKDGRLQKKRGPKPGPRSSSANKRPRLTSSRPVPKTALKNLKVGTVENDSSLNGKDSSTKVSYYCFSELIHLLNFYLTFMFMSQVISDLFPLAAQLKRTKEGRIDVSTPDSILTSIPLRTLISQRTFNMLPALYQHQLVTLLPKVDQSVGNDGGLRPSHSAFTNEFFASACHSWKDRLQEGDFMTDMQQKMKQEEERLAKLDPWKAKFFEPVWGKRTLSETDSSSQDLAHAYFTAPLSPAPAVSPRSSLPSSHRDANQNRSQYNSTRALTVPLKKLPSHCLPKRVTESRRSEAAKQLRANSNARPSRPRSIPIFRMVTVATATEALKAIRTCAPDNMLTASTIYTRKRTLKIPESASDEWLTKESTTTPLLSASILNNDTVDLRAPATLIKQRPPSRAAMQKQVADRENSSRRSTSSTSTKGSIPSTVASKGFSRSMLLKSCSCRLKAMEVCKKCGAFCHDDCISAAQLCSACVN
ncbi:PREDICTED: putative Polycomb group protein ASXL2 [Acropora digitifera]|uniref:putative Polycomb group protein ASXL2 n=1 Tax=Acropora digitifera TaxID=70779 RepID=UPI00077A9E97|nr:PREDICTED: putative Polycomb group protein ASXL2 [Acropora digitifera]